MFRRVGLFPGVKVYLRTLPFVLLSAFMLFGPGVNSDPMVWIPLLITFVFINVLFFQMVRTGRTDRYRAVFFVTMAVCFVLTFIANLIEVRGSMALTPEDMATGQTPFCHMVIPMTLIPAVFTKTIIFPGSILEGFANVATMFALWIGVSLALGRGFCSWGMLLRRVGGWFFTIGANGGSSGKYHIS